MDSATFTAELDKRVSVLVSAFIRAHGKEANIDKVNINSYYERGSISIKVIEKKEKKATRRPKGIVSTE